MSNLSPKQFNNITFSHSKEFKDVSDFNEGGYEEHTLHMHQDNKPVGHVLYADTGDEIKVDWMKVDPDKRRQGLGSRMVDELYQRYPKHTIDWQTTTEDSKGLQKKFSEKYPGRTA